MLEFVFITEDGRYTQCSYRNMEHLKQACKDRLVPHRKAPIVEAKLHGIPIYPDTFGGLIKIFGLDASD